MLKVTIGNRELWIDFTSWALPLAFQIDADFTWIQLLCVIVFIPIGHDANKEEI